MPNARKLLDSLMGSYRNDDRKVVAKKKSKAFLEDHIASVVQL